MAKKMDLRIWIEGIVVATTAIAPSFLPIEFVNSGLDLPLGMVLLVLHLFRRGLFLGVAAGFVWGMSNIILGTATRNFLPAPQIIFEHSFAFAFRGMGGVSVRKVQLYFQANRLKSAIRTTILGSVVAVFVRWFWHFWADVLVWGMYVPEGMSPYLYSSVLNGTSTVVNCLCVNLVLGSSTKVAPQLSVPRK